MEVTKVKIVIPENPDEFKAMEEIQRDAWNAEDITITPAHVLRAAQMSGNCVFLAYCGEEPAGYVFGFLGIHNKKLYLHSHQVGVKRKYQNSGIGAMLKLKQREYAINMGIDLIRWTFDPLQAKNAYFNFVKLGVVSREYIENLYGELRDGLNQGVSTDRFFVEWYILSPRVVSRIRGENRPPHIEDLEVTVVTQTRIEGTNLVVLKDYETSVHEKILAVEIPLNFNEIKERSLKLATDWRMGTRELFKNYLSKGYIVADLIYSADRRRCFYVLLKRSLNEVLNKDWWLD
ncbi:MAG: GNAT family N-acetyltransferase [Crenarchaeota archaeon]|nr:GNAT family N-acetyltransferase [Thermoproteota archaeon]MCR8453883.1 GNAT family N-acetyltransferase [Thermoproteota archaeon]MCR8455298.1 GNAT family N-acetyltransferase [Thermoproteota archaeon]MCR8462568.1 GNAT family N-acetyltransferase [Thermoproteota archaeon]MCR8470704.1 GNAT family N-acetyltransferase [Thermoproteota archaeon]